VDRAGAAGLTIKATYYISVVNANKVRYDKAARAAALGTAKAMADWVL
jgi:hypothetical protein